MTIQQDKNTIYCLLYTNTLLHFQPFYEVAWLKKLDVEKIILVLPPTTIQELDKHKSDPFHKARQGKARALLSKINQLLKSSKPNQPVELKKDVYLLDWVEEPQVEWLALHLDSSHNDDRLIATTLEFVSKYPHNRIVLISNDFGVRRKALNKGLEVLDPEGLLPSIELTSPDETTARKAEPTFPKLELGFWNNNKLTKHLKLYIGPFRSDENSEKQIVQTITEKNAKLQQILTKASIFNRDEAEIFKNRYIKYLADLERILRANRTKKYGYKERFKFVLVNQSNVEAIGILLKLKFPEGFFLVEVSLEKNYESHDLNLPEEPVAQWDLNPFGQKSIKNIVSAPYLQPILPRESQPHRVGPIIYSKNGNCALYRHPKLYAKKRWEMSELICYVPPETTGGFEIECTIEADNLPEEVMERLNIKLESKQ